MTAPNYIDPDKPFSVKNTRQGIPSSYKGNITSPGSSDTALIGGLIRCIQVLIEQLSQTSPRDQEWRIAAYRDIYKELTEHNHSGTGSEEEKKLHKALEIMTSLLGLQQSE